MCHSSVSFLHQYSSELMCCKCPCLLETAGKVTDTLCILKATPVWKAHSDKLADVHQNGTSHYACLRCLLQLQTLSTGRLIALLGGKVGAKKRTSYSRHGMTSRLNLHNSTGMTTSRHSMRSRLSMVSRHSRQSLHNRHSMFIMTSRCSMACTMRSATLQRWECSNCLKCYC